MEEINQSFSPHQLALLGCSGKRGRPKKDPTEYSDYTIRKCVKKHEEQVLLSVKALEKVVDENNWPYKLSGDLRITNTKSKRKTILFEANEEAESKTINLAFIKSKYFFFYFFDFQLIIN